MNRWRTNDPKHRKNDKRYAWQRWNQRVKWAVLARYRDEYFKRLMEESRFLRAIN